MILIIHGRHQGRRVSVWTVFTILAILFLNACAQRPLPAEPTPVMPDQPVRGEMPEEPVMGQEPGWAEQMLSAMTTEEKIGQLLMPAFRRNVDGSPLLHLDETTRDFLFDFQPGGVILFNENIDTEQQTTDLINEYQSHSAIPLFIAVDEEGGIVSRLTASGKISFPDSPGNQVLGSRHSPEEAAELGRQMACRLQELGFNMNMAPVADVNTNPQNPVIGARSFGADPFLVADFSVAMASGMLEGGVIPVLKHFPGHGDTQEDTHFSQVVVPHDRQRLESVEWVPFKAGIEAGLPAIMTAHLKVPAIIPNDRPSTLSPEMLTGILRMALGFQGVIITDALEMGAVTSGWPPGEAAVEAFLAGADILLMPASLQEAYAGLLEAVQEGRITEERLNESVLRILTLKEAAGLLK
ncbi:MAG: glycoside hydrolase family 3 protein [Bacillota bacterium]|nr:glycoside hydrolase family 3 protein [Bacillota bacterium]MDW7678873.1 glycoside hydrolase family 3 protein [Bacillota bacterium]